MRDGIAGKWGVVALEVAVLAALFVFYLISFEPSSAVNGPYEVFAQDSVYIFDSLARGESYPWNPQSHLLYHVVLELGHRGWQQFADPGLLSTYHYLKLFTALCGLGFLSLMCLLFRELGLAVGPRLVLLMLTGISVSAWFHFAAFESHCLGMPALALYLLALVRLRDRATRAIGDRLMLIASLLVCGLGRVDLFRLAVMSAPLLFLPRTRALRRTLVADLAIVTALGVLGSAWLAASYLDLPLSDATAAALERNDRGDLEDRLGRVANLTPRQLMTVGRAASIYTVLMPVEPRPPDRSFMAPPTYEVNLRYRGWGPYPSTGLFLESARHLGGYALSLLAMVGVVAALAWASILTAKRSAAGDVFHSVIATHLIGGWLLYTWFNPFEPFLWSVEFLPLWIAMIADHSRGRSLPYWLGIGLLTVVVGAHNWFAFYLPFRAGP